MSRLDLVRIQLVIGAMTTVPPTQTVSVTRSATRL
jgi:hypothetical protein